MSHNHERIFGSHENGIISVFFIESPISQAVDSLCSWYNSGYGGGYKANTTELKQCGKCWDQFLAPYVTPPDTAVFMPTESRWTAYVENCRNKGIPTSNLSNFARQLQIRTVAFYIDNIEAAEAFKRPYALQYQYWDGRQNPLSVRVLQLQKDYGWEFNESGKPCEFEQIELYAQHDVEKRLSADLLYAYARALGIRLDGSDNFYKAEEAIGMSFQIHKMEEEPPELTANFLSAKWKQICKGLGL